MTKAVLIMAGGSGERQKLEVEYYSKRGFWFDLGLIFKTIPAVLSHKGAK